ncbi:MAG: STAS/SEC14 domain-containing protein [Myxococcota bacterium]
MQEIQVGSHRVADEGDSMASIEFGGSPDELEMDEIMSHLVRMRAGGATYILIDFSRVDTLSAEARRVIGERSRDVDVKALAMYGASFHLRVIAKLVNAAIAMFKKDAVAQEFFSQREEAVAWLQSRRAAAGGEE